MHWLLNPVAGADFDEARNTSLSQLMQDQLLGACRAFEYSNRCM